MPNKLFTTSDRYEVEEIMGHEQRDGQWWYHVLWKNYPIEAATWEPSHHFDDEEILRQYWRNVKNAQED